MKEAIINLGEIIEITIMIKEKHQIKEIAIIIEIGEIKEIKQTIEIEICKEVIKIAIGIDLEIISHTQKEMKNIMILKKMIQDTGNLILIKMMASKMILKEKIVMIANKKSQKTLMLINKEINKRMNINKKKIMKNKEMEVRKALVSVL